LKHDQLPPRAGRADSIQDDDEPAPPPPCAHFIAERQTSWNTARQARADHCGALVTTTGVNVLSTEICSSASVEGNLRRTRPRRGVGGKDLMKLQHASGMTVTRRPTRPPMSNLTLWDQVAPWSGCRGRERRSSPSWVLNASVATFLGPLATPPASWDASSAEGQHP